MIQSGPVLSPVYLASYGLLGELGLFRSAIQCDRGDRAVLHTPRGLELGEVLREAGSRAAAMMPATERGTLLRLASPADERAAREASGIVAAMLHAAGERAAAMRLPLTILDAEMLLDREQAVLHFVRWGDCDYRPLVAELSRQFEVRLLLQDLSQGEDKADGCGSGNCGSGNCGSGGCGTGGCGTCGSMKRDEVKEYFSALREQMLASNRMPLV